MSSPRTRRIGGEFGLRCRSDAPDRTIALISSSTANLAIEAISYVLLGVGAFTAKVAGVATVDICPSAGHMQTTPAMPLEYRVHPIGPGSDPELNPMRTALLRAC